MIELILTIVVFVITFVVPILLRRILEFIQGLFAILAIIIFLSNMLDKQWETILFVIWVLGSLAAVSMNAKEEGERAQKNHIVEYHDHKIS
jgi:hypothetical protein